MNRMKALIGEEDVALHRVRLSHAGEFAGELMSDGEMDQERVGLGHDRRFGGQVPGYGVLDADCDLHGILLLALELPALAFARAVALGDLRRALAQGRVIARAGLEPGTFLRVLIAGVVWVGLRPGRAIRALTLSLAGRLGAGIVTGAETRIATEQLPTEATTAPAHFGHDALPSRRREPIVVSTLRRRRCTRKNRLPQGIGGPREENSRTWAAICPQDPSRSWIRSRSTPVEPYEVILL